LLGAGRLIFQHRAELEDIMTHHPNMQCPVCSVPLTMSERQTVEIDYCPQCRGVWLDRGELDKIIERSAVEQAPPVRREEMAAAPYLQSYGKPYHKRRKSFLEELFD
jgi:Zn-finger nucleic acid-binding protein